MRRFSVFIIVPLVFAVIVGAAPASANVGTKCTKVGQVNKKYSTVCTRVGKTLKWVKRTSSGSTGSGSTGSGSAGSSGASGGSSSLQLGTSCSGSGTYSWSSGALLTCKSGKAAYALPTDLPAAPTGGYTTRPSWYPTLSQIMLAGKSEPTCAPTSIRFTSPIVPNDKLAPSIPYGMAVSDHVTPIDHAYLGITALGIPAANRTEADYVNVMAPGDGTITELSSLGSSSSNRVVIDHGCNLISVFMVLNRPSGVLADAYSKLNGGSLSLNISVKAGQVIGQQRDNPLDYNVFDGTSWLRGFASPASYLTGETWKPYTADYLPFFSGETRDRMEAVLQRTASPRIGKIDHDVAGSAAGNWFLRGTFGYSGQSLATYSGAARPVDFGAVAGKNSYAWSHLAIVPHEVDTSKWVFSIGWHTNQAGDPRQFMLLVGAGQPEPNRLTVAAGVVVYDIAEISRSSEFGRAAGSTEPHPVGYTISAGRRVDSVALQVNGDGSLSLQFGTTLGAEKRTYDR